MISKEISHWGEPWGMYMSYVCLMVIWICTPGGINPLRQKYDDIWLYPPPPPEPLATCCILCACGCVAVAQRQIWRIAHSCIQSAIQRQLNMAGEGELLKLKLGSAPRQSTHIMHFYMASTGSLTLQRICFFSDRLVPIQSS